MNLKYKVHPWHGIFPGPKAPETVTAFIEIVPSDTVKYEIDKETGYLKIDRPQKFSNMIPTLYGFIPQTLCGEKIANNATSKSDGKIIRGDGDPLDICVLCERSVTHGDILLQAIPVGGFRLLDGDEADDKIIAVMKGDEFYHQWRDITDCPESYINRLKHYFLTYKNLPHEESVCKITEVYGREEAHRVINLALADYQDEFGEFHQ